MFFPLRLCNLSSLSLSLSLSLFMCLLSPSLYLSSGVARGRWGRSAPGGSKIEDMQKNKRIWQWEKYFYGGGGYKRAIYGRKIKKLRKKRSSKKFWGMTQKSRGAVNLRTAPGGRHPSYATVFISLSLSLSVAVKLLILCKRHY